MLPLWKIEANFLINVSMKFDVNSVKFAYRLKAGDMLCKYTMSKVKWVFSSFFQFQASNLNGALSALGYTMPSYLSTESHLGILSLSGGKYILEKADKLHHYINSSWA